MKLSTRVVNWVLRRVFQTVCRIDRSELAKVPLHGPMILVANHINFLEVPVMIPHLEPRPVSAIAKRESWDNPLFYFLFNVWDLIPIDRGMVDREAFRLAVCALDQNKILAISPEGTRSKTGRLLQGKPGVVALALRRDVPIIPVGFYGYENFWHNLKRLRRTDFHVSVGKPFRICLKGDMPMNRETRQAITDEIMYKIAELLPQTNWGYYQGADAVNYEFLSDN